MLTPCNKTFAYEELVKKNRTLSFFITPSLVIGIVLAVIFAVLVFVADSFLLFIPASIFALGGLIASHVCKSQFRKNSQAIVQIYLRGYNVVTPNDVLG